MSIRTIFPNSGVGRNALNRGALNLGGVRVPVSLLQRDLNQLFEEVFAVAPERRAASFTPQLDVFESENEYVVCAELPGVDEKDIEVSLKENQLFISGEKRAETAQSEGRRHVERRYGTFQRVIPLAAEVDEANIDASFNKGVLTVKLPKAPEVKPELKKISVRSH